MGYGLTVKADETLGLIQKNFSAGDGSSNSIKFPNGLTGFFEVSRKDQPDGGVAGTVQRQLNAKEKSYWEARNVEVTDTMVVPAGSFKINGDGKVIRFAGLPVAKINKELGA